ncbi:MAG: hypothetical protein ABWY16_08765 [Pedobacter sp.]|uniref:hypothetical protein n=1 Tax=Pedobacter sp. TaxID=1411316 RepID=UPI003394D4CE
MVKNKDFKIHKGEFLNGLVRKKGIKIKVLTQAAGFDRSTFYNHIKQPNLSFGILLKYGKILNHDFAEDFPEMITDQKKPSSVQPSYEELAEEKDYWKEKYFHMLELYHQCMQQQKGN